MPRNITTGRSIRAAWSTLRRIPGGKAVFSRCFGLFVPYSGTIRPRILELDPGFARIEMRDHRAVRNHLSSVHAIALMNVGEMASGLAMLAGLPDDARAIITKLSMEYVKKARGTLTAECRCEPPVSNAREEHVLLSEVRDAAGEVVARCTAHWLVGPV